MDDQPEQRIELPYDDASLQLQTHEAVMSGSLEATSMVQFQYYVQDILCIEKLELETLDQSMHFNIIQVNWKSSLKLFFIKKRVLGLRSIRLGCYYWKSELDIVDKCENIVLVGFMRH